MRVHITIAIVLAACGPGSRHGDGPCQVGQTKCDGNTYETCVDGQFKDSMDCPDACDEQLGCVLCVPNTGTCNGNDSHACNSMGTGYVDTTCDPVQGESCDATMGVCTGACAPLTLGLSYIGCEYFPTVTGNLVGNNFDFAVAIANTGSQPAMVTIEDGALTSPMTVTVAPATLLVQKLPWQQTLKLCNNPDTPETGGCNGVAPPSAAQVSKGAYHLRSTSPVTVYQFNSLEYVINSSDFSYSNDASLLLPTNVWRDNYYTAAWEQVGGTNPSEMAVTAWQDNTMVTLNTTATTIAGGGAPAFTAGTPGTVMLNAGDVLEITSATGDFTGTNVSSTAPVSVIGGHFCADIPDTVGYCDHIEESMFGVDTLGENYIVNAPAVTSIPTGKVEVIRIIATQPNTTLNYNPPQAGAPASIAMPGQFVEIDNNANSFEISASNKVLVAQYMEGQDAGGGTGDPAMALAVPFEQFRTSYTFQAPTSYDSNYVDVTAPMGASVMLDGAAPLPLTAIGSTGYGLSRVEPLGNGPAGDGNHTITGDMPFGITVYGYGQYTSYWYPGGLDLKDIIE
ncbi:MAG TPA: IgGFc-binding protein [Kofleriaceae bacterium]|nr:IgGFc-binding protein [Kofleriaceae bacterium]